MSQKFDGKGWIGVDLDGTLAHYDHWRGKDHIGEPIWPMVMQVRKWIEEGEEVKIFTARVGIGRGYSPHSGFEDTQEFADEQREMIGDWSEEIIGTRLEVTAQKDWGMKALYDDRAMQVITNKGTLVVDAWKDLFRHVYQLLGGEQL